VISLKARFRDWFLKGRTKGVTDKEREIQQEDKDWHLIFTRTGVMMGWVTVRHKRGIGRKVKSGKKQNDEWWNEIKWNTK
jgi:hypothetical protein